MSTAFKRQLEEVGRVKRAVRERVWALLERERVARSSRSGHAPWPTWP